MEHSDHSIILNDLCAFLKKNGIDSSIIDSSIFKDENIISLNLVKICVSFIVENDYILYRPDRGISQSNNTRMTVICVVCDDKPRDKIKFSLQDENYKEKILDMLIKALKKQEDEPKYEIDNEKSINFDKLMIDSWQVNTSMLYKKIKDTKGDEDGNKD